MKKSVTAYLLFTLIFFIPGCKPKEKTIDLGIKKTDVVKSEEVSGGTKVSISKTEFDFGALKEKNNDLDFEQEGNTVLMRRANSVSGSFECTCVNPTGANAKCKVVITGTHIACQNDGCTGTCEMFVTIKDAKITRFW